MVSLAVTDEGRCWSRRDRWGVVALIQRRGSVSAIML